VENVVTEGVMVATIECFHNVKSVLKEDSVITIKFIEINFWKKKLYYQNNIDRITDLKKQKYNLQKNEIYELKNQIIILSQKLNCVI